MCLTPLYSKYATSVELRHFCRLHSCGGVDMSFVYPYEWHVHTTTTARIPKQVFYGQLHHGLRRLGGQYKRYKDCLKSTMTQRGITPSELETLVMDRAGWHSTCKSAVEEFEVRRIQELEAKRDLRKSGPPSTSNFECQICHQMCLSRIGLLAHNKSHSWWWNPSYRWLSLWSWHLACQLGTTAFQLLALYLHFIIC